jgi:ribulose-phosphate 3-epimerase
MKRKVIPTVFAFTKGEFNEKLNVVSKVSKVMQVDFMDGRFTGRKGVKLSEVPSMPGSEAHLMVKEPAYWLPNLKKKGFKKVLFHYESSKDIDSCYNLIFCGNRLGLEMFVVFNPSTSLKIIKEFVGRVKGIMFMGVVPGKQGQRFIPEVLAKIMAIRKMSKKLIIQVDGGVNISNIGKLKKAGADIVNTGSYVSESENPRKALMELQKKFK